METLAFGDTEIERASEPFSADGKQFAAGSYVIHMQQPFSGWAKTLLEKQQYPDLRLYPGGPPKRPYDVTAQTLPMQMGVDVVTVKDTFRASLAPASSIRSSWIMRGRGRHRCDRCLFLERGREDLESTETCLSGSGNG